MPRGGHFGLWKPTPKDIFKSRWKRFYKRTYRLRSFGNEPDHPGPHKQPTYHPDGVPAPWRLQYSTANWDLPPPDARRYACNAYELNVRRFLQPAVACKEPAARDAVLRALDAGRRGTDSGLGRLALAECPREGPPSEAVPAHIYGVLRQQSEASAALEGFWPRLIGQGGDVGTRTFPVRRLRELLEEKEIVWDTRALDSDRKASPRGHFPFIDEHASLVDDLPLHEILRLRHRNKSRRHPKWREIQYEHKKNHKSYLRRRQMKLDEVQARMGVLKQALADG